jgi:hypothetical protein
MSDIHTPYRPDPDQLRTERTYFQLIHTLYARLPPPLDDTPEALAARNEAALAQVAAVAPVNGDEAEIAAHCVATRAQPGDVLLSIRRLDPCPAVGGSARQEGSLRGHRALPRSPSGCRIDGRARYTGA